MGQKPRIRLTFTLRGLLVGIALLGLGPGWWVPHLREQSRRQMQVVGSLRDQVRNVQLVNLFADRGLSSEAQPWWRKFLGKALGPRIDSMNCDFKPLADITSLSELRDLRSLSINGTQVSDLAPLANLGNLEELDLRLTAVSDLAPLAGLAKLQTLLINDTRCDDIRPIVGPGNLQKLTLTQTQFHDLLPLTQLSSLRTLELRAERFTSEQLEMRGILSEALPDCKIYQDLVYRER